MNKINKVQEIEIKQGGSDSRSDYVNVDMLSQEAEYVADSESNEEKDRKIAELERIIEDKEKECEALSDRSMRIQADFENYKRRALKEKEEMRLNCTADVILSLLPGLDNMQRAIASADNASAETLKTGIEMVYKQFEDSFSQLGLEKVASEDIEFDPECHEAVCVEESVEYPDNHVMQELQPGYRIKGKLLRPAIVKVCRNCNDNQ